MNKKITDLSKDILVGKRLKTLDNIIFRVSGKCWTGWRVGNILRSFLEAKKEGFCKAKVIFIGGFARSGTTLFQMILKSLESIDGPYNEFCVFQDFFDDEFTKDSFNMGKFDNIPKREMIKRANFIFNEYLKITNSEWVVLKAPKNILFLKWIFKYFPNAKYINMVRDGRDASLSFKKYIKEALKREYPLDYSIKNWASSIRMVEKFRSDSRFLEIRYEDLIEDYVKTITNTIKFIGLEVPPKKELAKFTKNIDKSSIPKTHRNQVSSKLYSSSKGRWKREMKPPERENFKKLAGEELVKMGYEKNNNW